MKSNLRPVTTVTVVAGYHLENTKKHMKQEEKELLLRDLSSRFPYGVKGVISYDAEREPFTVKGFCQHSKGVILHLSDAENCYITDFIPYYRPLSSMTEEERREFKKRFNLEFSIDEIWGHSVMWNTGSSDEYIDVEFELVDMDLISVWLDKKMFDWRRIKNGNMRVSMIKAGLALPAPDSMYNF